MTYMELQTIVNNMRGLRNQVSVLVFGNADKDTFKNELVAIADCLLSVDFMRTRTFTPFLPDQYISYVDLIIKWLVQLLNAHAYRLNDEMSFCIEKLIERWDLQHTQKIVVFTLGEFAVQKIKRNINTNQIDYLLDMSRTTGVQLTKEPVFIKVPDEFKDHILANVALFHEVGHFVDRDNCITDLVFTDVYALLQAKKRSKFKREYFPRYEGKDVNTIADSKAVVWSHIEEFIADVFGAQYAHEHILSYASFLEAKSSNRDSKSHPSLNSRRNLVSAFLRRSAGKRVDSPLLDAIQLYLPNLVKVDSPFTEGALIAPDLRFTDIDEMFSCFTQPWTSVINEAKNSHLKRESKADYLQVLAIQKYQDFDNNIKSAIHELMNRP